MLTQKEYCDYETCVALKELGYNEKSNWWFNKVLNEEYDQMQLVHICDNPAHLNYDSWGICPKDFVIRPTMWEAQKWLREEKTIGVFVSGFKNGYTFWVNNLLNGDTLYQGFFDNQTGEKYKSYEEALSEGIKEAVKLLKEK